MQTYFGTQQSLSALLEQARQRGEVRIRREDGQTFLLRPENAEQSALDVEGVDLDISADEIIDFIRAGRKQF